MDKNLLKKISELQSFKEFSEVDLEKVIKFSFCRDFFANEFVIHEGVEAIAAYFLLSGQVEVLRMSLSGREQILTRLYPGQAFNTAPFFLAEKQNPASVRAVVDSQVLVIPAVHFLALLDELPVFNHLVMQDYSERLKSLTTRVEELGLYSVRARLARFLLKQADQPGKPLRWTQDEIARHIGTVRDVVGRSLRSLQADGLIQLQRHQIRLLDRAALQEIANSE